MGQVGEQRRFQGPEVTAVERPIAYCGKVVEHPALDADRLLPFSVVAEYLADSEVSGEPGLRID